MNSRLFPIAAALLALLGGPAKAGIEFPAEPVSFPAVAPGVPHTYIVAVQSDGVPLDVLKAIEIRDAFVARAAPTGWKIAPHANQATVVVHLNLSAKGGLAQSHNRALIWADFVNIYSGDEGLLAEETLSPVYIVPVAYLDYPFGYWDFAYSNFCQPGTYYRPFVRHHGHPVSPICPPRTKSLMVSNLLRRVPAVASPLPAIASLNVSGSGRGGHFWSHWTNPYTQSRSADGGSRSSSGAGGGHSWSGGSGHSGGGGEGHSWSGGGGGHAGGGGGGGGGGAHASGGSGGSSNQPK